MPVKKKVAKKSVKKMPRKAAPKKTKKTYVCVPCGSEITVSREGMGVTHLMCCGQVMQPKGAKK